MGNGLNGVNTLILPEGIVRVCSGINRYGLRHSGDFYKSFVTACAPNRFDLAVRKKAKVDNGRRSERDIKILGTQSTFGSDDTLFN